MPDLLELQAVAGPCDGQDLSTAGQVLSVGRTKLSKIHIKDPAVSEKHAEFSWSGSGWMLRDLGSSNGTAVNGTKLQSEGVRGYTTSGKLVSVCCDLYEWPAAICTYWRPGIQEHMAY